MSTPSPDPRPVTATGVLVIVCVLLASGGAGFLAHRLFTPQRAALYPETRPPGQPRSVTEAAPVRKIPEELPDIALPALDGTTQRLTQWKGKPLLINFWATWCEPCRREIPLLKKLHHERAADGLQIVGIAVDSRDATLQYAQSHGIDYPVLVGQQGGLEAVAAFGMDTVLPFSVFVDEKGRILTLKIGELHRDEAERILGRLAEVSAGKLSPGEARAELSSANQKLDARRMADTTP